MQENNTRIFVQMFFTLVLLVLFIVFFGYPAISKFFHDEVFIKVSTEPKERANIVNIPLPAITLCGSDVASVISQGWKEASFDYRDLVFIQCGNNNSNIESKEIYQCIYNKTYSLEEIQVGLFLGTGIEAKVLTDPSIWQMDLSATYFGRCYTLEYPEKVGSHLDTFLMMFDLNTNLTYDIFIHDPSYYLTTLSPSAFPHIRIKRRPIQPLDQSRNFDLLYVTETKHKKLNRKEYRCNEKQSYNFRTCVKKSVIDRIECRMEWDEAISDAPLCQSLDKIRAYEKQFLYLSQVEERVVIQDTGCLPPCEYSEYKLVEKIEGFVAHYGMGLAYATTEVMVEEEDWVYPGLSFIAEFGGALGMFLGFSFYMFWDLGEFAIKKCSKSNVEAVGLEMK